MHVLIAAPSTQPVTRPKCRATLRAEPRYRLGPLPHALMRAGEERNKCMKV